MNINYFLCTSSKDWKAVDVCSWDNCLLAGAYWSKFRKCLLSLLSNVIMKTNDILLLIGFSNLFCLFCLLFPAIMNAEEIKYVFAQSVFALNLFDVPIATTETLDSTSLETLDFRKNLEWQTGEGCFVHTRISSSEIMMTIRFSWKRTVNFLLATWAHHSRSKNQSRMYVLRWHVGMYS